ncbi:OB-fold nucleic acid binding domain-containing protein [Tateyamaria sp. syn59]|uniref:OB-fold nucleic acid binding domain-containing protein n=1 Tax=Tateyamaria sp. syn59 TaxID=2576942 RepID=UPI0011BD991D
MQVFPPPRSQIHAHAPSRGPAAWPRPPSCMRASELNLPPLNARVAVAGLVILRQRPGTAKGVIFLTLEDETGVVNIIVWRHIYERFRRAVVAGRMLKVTGRMQRAHNVTHVLAEEIEDISPLLDQLLAEGTGRQMGAEARTDTWDSRRDR